MWLFRFFRFKNLLIVALTQYLLYFLLLIPNFQASKISPSLDNFHFFLLVLTTVLIAAGGYVINDITDYEIDKMNKPEKVFINNQISMSGARILYFSIILSGGIIAIYLAFYVRQFPLFFIYPVAVFLLWAYSKYFKKRVLTGNVIVSVFCAFVAGIVLFAERAAFWKLKAFNPDEYARLFVLFGGYLLFAFFSTVFREIIKDLEDKDGDEKLNCRTLPIVFDQKTAKITGAFFGIILFILVAFFGIWLWEKAEIPGLIFTISGILLPLFYSIVKLLKAQTKTDFADLSKYAKFIMISGLILLIIINLP